MPDIVLKDRGNEGKTYAGVESVELQDANGNPVEYYGGGKFDDYYKKSETYSQGQVNTLLAESSLSNQSDYGTNDEGDPRYIQNRPCYDSRQFVAYAIQDHSSSDDTVTFGGMTWLKVADKPMCSNTAALFKADEDTESYVQALERTSVRITIDGTTYYLHVNAMASVLILAAFGTDNVPSGHVCGSWFYGYPYGAVDKQTYYDDTKDFFVNVMFVREGISRAYDADGNLTSFGAGTYVSITPGKNAQVTSGTVAISYGILQKLDDKYVNLSGYAKTTDLTDLENALLEKIAAILPAFTSADEGKVLGIKNGKLAWVKVETANDELLLEQAYNVVESASDELYIDGPDT